MGLEGEANSLNFLVEGFFASLKRRNKAPKTIKRWRPELARFVAWAGTRQLSEIKAADLDGDFLVVWEAAFKERTGREPSPNSLRAVIQALRSFYAWLERFDRLIDADGHPFRNPALALETPVIRPAAEIDWLHKEEDEKLLNAYLNAQERILVFLLRFTGLRLDEAVSLTNRDIDLEAASIRVRQSKSPAGYRTVPVVPELIPELEAWIERAKREGLWEPDGPFLVTRNHTAMKPQYVGAALARAGRKAGLARKLTPHQLRRTFGSHLLNQGVRIEIVSKLLGHASTTITEKAYARLEDKTVREELLRAVAG